MVQSIVWAVVFFVIVFCLIWKADKWFNSIIDVRRRDQDAREKNDALKRQERQNKADLATSTAVERAELKRAELTQKTAEAKAAAQVAEATVPARIEEENQVIAARAEGRALAAKDRALNAGDSSDMEHLRAAYEAYVRRVSYPRTFSEWLDVDFVITDGRLSTE